MKRKIELKEFQGRYTLIVNGYTLGQYIDGKSKDYLDPKKWADKQIKKRNAVLKRNIDRLKNELEKLEAEKIMINM